MTKIFVPKLPNGSGNEEAEYYTYADGKFETYTSMADLYKGKPLLVSFDWDSVTTWLSERKETLPLNIADIEQMAKQLFGVKVGKNEQKPWSIWSLLSSFYTEEEEKDFSLVQKVYYGLEDVGPSVFQRLYKQLLVAMHQCHEDLLVKLKESDELDRYEDVERVIRMINLERTYRGISINTENVADWITAITRDVYKLRNQLQLEYGIISLTDKSTVLKKIEDRAFIKDAVDLIDEKGYYFFLKDSKGRSPLIKLLYEEKKGTTDLKALLAIGALKPVNKKIYPVYDSFGTITARTKITTPNLQNLSRKYRTIIQAEKDKELIYIDYSQFEAGILANDSEDDTLMSEYNNADIYTEIGKKIKVETYITNIEEQRKFCKSLFYKYSYGMDISKHNAVLKDYGLFEQRATISPLIIAAFANYKELEKFRAQIKKDLKANNSIGTHSGNYRYKSEDDHNLSWGLSQRIQGTASLILKKAIIRVRREEPKVQFLIPMHDAALFQVDKKLVEEKKPIIKKIFEDEFSKECPMILTSAKFKNFWDE